MKRTVAVVGSVFAISLAVLIGTRMSSDALGMLVGVVCGVLASLPTSLVLVWALVRRTQGTSVEVGARHQMGSNTYPPVVVVNPGPGYGIGNYGQPPLASMDRNMMLPAGQRSFKVVGDEETLLDNAGHIFQGLSQEWAEDS